MPDDLKPETPQETLSRVLDTVTKTKAWAAAKAESVERRIAELGGAPTPAVQDLIDKIRAQSASEAA